jgi:hypothetical protein
VASLSLPNFGLTRISDITNFEEGDTLVASATDGSALRSGSIVIDQITGNYLSGFTLHIGSGSITSFANGDFLYKQGDAANGGSNVRIAGVPNWTGTGTLFGVTRTTDQRRLSVLSPDYSSSGTPKSPLEALTDMAISIKLNGGAPDLCFVNPLWYATLANELAGRVLIVNVKPSDSATISFDGIQVSLPGAGGVARSSPGAVEEGAPRAAGAAGADSAGVLSGLARSSGAAAAHGGRRAVRRVRRPGGVSNAHQAECRNSVRRR